MSEKETDDHLGDNEDAHMNEHHLGDNDNENENGNGNGNGNGDDSELSDLDEDQFKDIDIEKVGGLSLDDEVYKLKSHKKQGASSSKPTRQKTRTTKAYRRDNDDEIGFKRVRNNDEYDDDDDDEDVNLDPETRRRRDLERRLDSAIKKPTKRSKRINEDDLEQLQDENISKLRDKMREAAFLDSEAIKDGQAATNKLSLLNEVINVLQKSTLADSILDNNLLESIRLWLEPLPDASLPAYSIQKELFNSIVKLPIKTIHLRESGLGKVMIFYQRSKRVELSIKRIADKLVGDWTRPIMGRSDNYKDKAIETRNYDFKRNKTSVNHRHNSTGGPKSAGEEAAARRGRAAVPMARPVTYMVAPRTQISGNTQGIRTGIGSSLVRDDQYKRIKQKLIGAGKSGKTKKSGVSIEGRGLS